ncbi:uncharacterized protein FYW49_012814 [Xenentodon cancila]
MECHDRYFMTAVDLAVTGEDPHFEAVDGTGAYALTAQYAAECGYTISVLPFLGLVELRASYFSCHTEKEGDGYTFSFNLIATLDGEETSYGLNRTCLPQLPWSPREVSCELNYMEVSVEAEVGCFAGTGDWNLLRPMYSSSDWLVTFQKPDEQMLPMNLSEAYDQGYMFDMTHERIVFRTPYGQPDSYSSEVTGVPVEVVHASVFSRQSWAVLIVDLVAACSTYEASHDGGYMTWETPEALYPSLGGSRISVGLNADLMEQAAAEQRGFIMEKRNTTIHIGIPYNAEGGYRKSFVKGAIFEFYVFHLYFKQVLVDEDYKETVITCHRLVVTPLLPCELLTENQTILEERVFTIYLGQIPDDVDLTSVQLNGNDFTVAIGNERIILTEASEPNNTHSYTLKVSFDDPVVIQEFSREHGAMLHKLAVDYMLTVPGNEPYYHTASFVALQNVSPPVFESNCTSSGISFKLGFRPFDYLWQFSIGSDLLTSALAAERGYIMTNDSQSLLLDVPLFTRGYEYRDVTLMGFLGTFEILVRDGETSEVQASSVKTCPFTSREFIMCSTDGRMTVVADLSATIPSGQIPAGFHLRNELCYPNDVNGTRVLFSFPVNSCGAIVKLSKGNVAYENKILYSINANYCDDAEGVTVRCTYPLAGLHRLFSVYTFESDMEGVGTITHAVQPTAV